MDRRNFFRSALKKGGETAIKVADAHVKKQASRWIRPPFAINELEFLLACTRCGDCVAACNYGVIFSLSAKAGVKAAATPALDLLNKGCHLCADWPCVNACKAGALLLPEYKAETTQADTDTPDMPLANNTEDIAENDTASNDTLNKTPPPKLAKASIDKQSCLPYSGPECGACFGSCPIPDALTQDMFRPVINPALCNGCALCRESCIVDPKAIMISSI